MGRVFGVVGPVRREDLVGLATEQQIELLGEDAADLCSELLIEVWHRPAAELEAPGRIFGRPAGRLHDAIHGHLSADDDLAHDSLSFLLGSSTTAHAAWVEFRDTRVALRAWLVA